MKGAMADPFASTNSAPTATRVINIGASQYFLFSLMNCHSSLMTWIFDTQTPNTSFRNAVCCVASLSKGANTTGWNQYVAEGGPNRTVV